MLIKTGIIKTRITQSVFKRSTVAMVAIGTIGLLSLSACSHLPMTKHCIELTKLYQAADQRSLEQELFQQALSCSNPETVKVALTNLGRIGGEQAANLIQTQLSHESVVVRAQAAFAAGISLTPELTPVLIEQFSTEKNSMVQEKLALAIGNLGHDSSAEALYKIINQAPNDLAARGAMQGLGILALFHGDKLVNKQKLDVDRVLQYLDKSATSLQASFLLARVPLISSSHIAKVKAITDELDNDSQAFAIRAIGNLKSKEHFDWLYQKALSQDLGIRISAIGALGKLSIGDNQMGNKEQINKINKLALSSDLITSITSLQAAAKWLSLDTLNQLLTSKSSWIQAQAFSAMTNPKSQKAIKLAKSWLESEDPNLQRAAIGYFAKQEDSEFLRQLAASSKKIVANGAKQALKTIEEESEEENNKPLATPKSLPSLPKRLTLKTTKGDIQIELFADTPYSSANFIQLARNGFYDGSYFHRVIPNFVAQGGGKVGDGSGSVGHSIREELNSRSHHYGTVGMATAGKDTGGAQFFINLAPNLHLDSNYTIFGKVISGMEIALKLEQNDQILSTQINN